MLTGRNRHGVRSAEPSQIGSKVLQLLQSSFGLQLASWESLAFGWVPGWGGAGAGILDA